MLLRWFFSLILSCLLVLGGVCSLRAEVKVLEVRHRSAAELASALEPLLGPEGSVSAYNGQLILRGTSRELSDLEKVVRQLDVTRSTLRLSVRQSANGLSSGQRAGLGGGGQAGRESSLTATGRFERTLGTAEQTSDQFIQVLDGEEAYIAVGREVPFTRELAVLAGRHMAVAQRTEFRQVSTGFRVRPQLLEDFVQLELTPHMEAFEHQAGDGVLTFSTLTSTVLVPLGQWYDLAGHLEGRDEVSRAILSRQMGTGQSQRQVLIRVDRAGQ